MGDNNTNPPPVVVGFQSSDAQMVAAMEKLVKMQEKVSGANRKQNTEMEKGNQETSKFVGHLGKMAASIGSVAMLSKVVSDLGQYMRHLSEETSRTHKGFIGLVGIQSDSRLGERASRMAQYQGARYGLGAQESANTVQVMQSLFGEAEGFQAAERAFQLRVLGATEQGSANVLKFGRAGGLSPEKSAIAALLASDRSSLSLTEISDTFTALQGYKDPIEGAAALSAMSGDFKGEELRTAARNAGLALTNPNSEFVKRMSSLSKKQGIEWDSASMQERLGVITGSGITDSTGLARAGLTEKESYLAVASLLRNTDKVTSTEAELRNAKPGLLEERIRSMEENNPGIRRALMIDSIRAQREYAKTWGRDSGLSQDNQLIRESARYMLDDKGYGFLNEGILGGVIDKGFDFLLAHRSSALRTMDDSGSGAGAGGDSREDVAAQLAAALSENNRLTAENNRAMTSRQPVMALTSPGI